MLVTAIAVAVRFLLDPVLADGLPFLTLFPAIAVASWYGGYGPALLASGTGYLAVRYLFIPPRGTLGYYDTAELVGLFGYLGASLIIVIFGEAMHRARRRAEANAREATQQRERLRTTLASIGDGVITTDVRGQVTMLNSMAQRLTGWPPEEAQGKALGEVFRIINEQTGEAAASPVDRVLREGVIVGLGNHTILVARDGSRLPIDDSAAPIRDSEGNITGVVLVFRDVTERRAAERALRDSEARKAAFLENALDAIITMDFEGKVLEFNPAAERIFGYSRGEAVGREMASLIIPPALRERHRRGLARYLATGEGPILDARIEMPGLRKDGTEFPVELTVTRILTPGLPIFTAHLRDITDRARRERRRSARLAVTQLLTRVDTLEEAAPGVLEGIGTNLGWEVGALWLVDPEQQILRCHTFWPAEGVSVPRFERITRERTFPPGVGLPGRIWTSRRPAWIPDVTRDGNFPRAPFAARDGLHGAFGFPIEHGGEVLGVMEFFSHEIREPDPDLLEMVATLGSQMGQLLERRRLDRRVTAQLREADRKKDEFLAILSHELRNPLAPLRHALELLRHNPQEADANRANLGVMERQLSQLVRLVDDLLDLSRITSGQMELRKEPVELAQVVRNAVETSRPLIQQAHHELSVSLPAQPVWLEGDPVRLAQVVANLLNNAARYTEPGGRISVRAVVQDSEAVVTVEDTGIGIPREKLPQIFDMFAQVGQPLERTRGGLGIGLTLVKRLVEMHGGRVEVASEGEHRGTRFTVRVPAPLSAREPVAAAEPARPGSPGHSRRILVVDDNRDSAMTLGALLAHQGHEVRTEFDGEAALAAAEAFRPEIVLLDIGLPKLNGYEICQRIRERPWSEDVTLIALTGWGQEADKARARVAGFHHHLVKPVDPGELEKLIE
ncbi:MAG: PAS domain S-box protein [Gemmatimonadales bacterium]